jgi:hypothetical protein
MLNVNNMGEFNEISKLDFLDSDVYIVDDEKTIYIWVGNDVTQELKDKTAGIARTLDKDRGGAAKILIMKQKREYGSFLAMMDDLKKGLIPGHTIERRPELELTLEESDEITSVEEVEEPEVVQWLNQVKQYRKSTPEEKYLDVIAETVEEEIEPSDKMPKIQELPEGFIMEDHVKVGAYYLSKEGYDYNELCWILAEKIMKESLKMPSIEDIRQKAEQVFASSCTYDELCWLNAEIDILRKYFFEEKKPSFFD